MRSKFLGISLPLLIASSAFAKTMECELALTPPTARFSDYLKIRAGSSAQTKDLLMPDPIPERGVPELLQIAADVRQQQADKKTPTVTRENAAPLLNWAERTLVQIYNKGKLIDWSDKNVISLDHQFSVGFNRKGLTYKIGDHDQNNATQSERAYAKREWLLIVRSLYYEVMKTKLERNVDFYRLNLVADLTADAAAFLRSSDGKGNRTQHIVDLIGHFRANDSTHFNGLMREASMREGIVMHYAGDLSVPEFNELFPYQIFPLGLIDEISPYDGSSLPRDPYIFLEHDRGHALGAAHLPTANLATRLEMHAAFKSVLASSDLRARHILEVSWFEMFHESYVAYDPEIVLAYLKKYESAFPLRKMNSQYYYESEYPDLYKSVSDEEAKKATLPLIEALDQLVRKMKSSR